MRNAGEDVVAVGGVAPPAGSAPRWLARLASVAAAAAVVVLLAAAGLRASTRPVLDRTGLRHLALSGRPAR